MVLVGRRSDKTAEKLAVNVHKFVSKEPTVKFRGIFINDEDWGLYRWSKNNYEKERGNFGPKTYAQVCELLLRLQANYLCPAMHDASMAFHRIPEIDWLQIVLLSLWVPLIVNRCCSIRQANGNVIRWGNGITSIIGQGWTVF